jgi:hypothetical protein
MLLSLSFQRDSRPDYYGYAKIRNALTSIRAGWKRQAEPVSCKSVKTTRHGE